MRTVNPWLTAASCAVLLTALACSDSGADGTEGLCQPCKKTADCPAPLRCQGDLCIKGTDPAECNEPTDDGGGSADGATGNDNGGGNGSIDPCAGQEVLTLTGQVTQPLVFGCTDVCEQLKDCGLIGGAEGAFAQDASACQDRCGALLDHQRDCLAREFEDGECTSEDFEKCIGGGGGKPDDGTPPGAHR